MAVSLNFTFLKVSEHSAMVIASEDNFSAIHHWKRSGCGKSLDIIGHIPKRLRFLRSFSKKWKSHFDKRFSRWITLLEMVKLAKLVLTESNLPILEKKHQIDFENKYSVQNVNRFYQISWKFIILPILLVQKFHSGEFTAQKMFRF